MNLKQIHDIDNFTTQTRLSIVNQKEKINIKSLQDEYIKTNKIKIYGDSQTEFKLTKVEKLKRNF